MNILYSGVRLLLLFFINIFYRLSYKYLVILVLVFGGALTSIVNLSMFMTGGEIYIISELAIQNVVWIALLIFYLVRAAIFYDFLSLKVERWVFVYFLYVIYTLVAMLWTSYTSNAVRDFLFTLFPLVLYLSTLYWMRECDDGFCQIRKMFWYGFWVVGVLTLYSVAIGRPLFGVDYGGVERFWGPMGWSALGYFLLPYCIDRFVMALVRGGFFNYLTFALVLLIFLLTLGRLSMLALGISMVIIFYFWKGDPVRKLKLSIAGGLIALVGISIILPPILQRTFGDNGEFQWSGRNNSTNYVESRLETTLFSTIMGSGSGSARSVSEELRGISSEVRSKYYIVFKDYGVLGLSLYILSVSFLLISSIKSLYSYSRIEDIEQDKEYSLIVNLLAMRLACAIFITLLGAFDNLTFIYIISMYFVFFAAAISVGRCSTVNRVGDEVHA